METTELPPAVAQASRPLCESARKLASENLDIAEQMARWQFRRCHRMVPLDELISESMFGLVYAAGMFDPSRSVPFGTYARLAIRHRLTYTVKRWLRGGTRHARNFADVLAEPDQQIDPVCHRTREPIEAIQTHELVESLRRRMNPRWYRIFELYYAEGCTMREVGKRVGVSRERVRQLLDKAKARARAILN